MCGQWSPEGYIQNNTQSLQNQMGLADLMRVVDGPEPIHDRIRGVGGTFNRVWEGLVAGA